MHILVVEDDSHTAGIIERCFKGARHNVTIRHSTQEAAKKVYEREYDLILIGWTTPGLAGTEFVRHLRASRQHENIPIVMFTLKASTADVEDALDAGVDVYVLKRPLGWQRADCKTLLDRVRAAYEKKKQMS